MKKYVLALLATSALTFAASAASAADLPRRAMAPAPMVAAVPAFTWTGFYFGGNAGYGWSDHNHSDTITFTGESRGFGGRLGTVEFVDRDKRDADGFTGGAQVGINYQFTPGTGFVIGVEADIQALDLGRDHNNRNNDVVFTAASGSPFTTLPGVGAASGRASFFRDDVTDLDWFGTVRGRLGYAFDQFLVYGTGGLAYANTNRSDRCGAFAAANGFSAAECGTNGDDTRYGYAVGGGVEWALPWMAGLFGTTATTFKIEGLYVNLDEDNHNRNRLQTVGFRDDGTAIRAFRAGDNELDFAVVRAGINFKF